MRFFNPTSELKELLLLQHIEKKPDTTQKILAEVISSAVSMVNVYIVNLENKGYLNRIYKSSKVVYYNITQEGIKRKKLLSITYLHELLDLYRLAEENVENFLKNLENEGYEKILLYGAGEVAETIIGIIKRRTDKRLKIVAIIDDKHEINHTEFLGYKIIPRDDIQNYIHDGIIITSYSFEDNIRKKLEEIDYPEYKIKKFFTE